jgi:hypothetical protein
MADPVQETYPIEYEDAEGNQYSEVHGDPDKNLTVVSKAQQEGALQSNTGGTTPDPHNPELTDLPAEEEEASSEGPSAPPDQKQVQTPPANKQAPTPANK